MRVHEITASSELKVDDLLLVVQRANQFSSEIIMVLNDGEVKVDAKSVLGVMMYPIRRGMKIGIRTKGADEEEALHEMCEMLEKRHFQAG